MKKIIFAASIMFLAAACSNQAALNYQQPPADNNVGNQSPDSQNLGSQPGNSASSAQTSNNPPPKTSIKEGSEVVLQGTVLKHSSSGIPDTGSNLLINTAANEKITILLPGNIRCQASRLDSSAKAGQQVEVRGLFSNGAVSVCGSSSYYLKILAAPPCDKSSICMVPPIKDCPPNAMCVPLLPGVKAQ